MRIATRIGLPLAVVGSFVLTAGLLLPPKTSDAPDNVVVVEPLPRDGVYRGVYDDLEGCFVEWNEREAGDAELVVELQINPDGRVRSSTVVAGTDHEALRYCVTHELSSALRALQFPTRGAASALRIRASWTDKLVLAPL